MQSGKYANCKGVAESFTRALDLTYHHWEEKIGTRQL